MEYIDVSSKPPEDSTPITLVIGKFDGVHRGHSMLLQKAREYNDGILAVMSFSEHPSWVLRNEADFQKSLTPLKHKMTLLQNLGVERFYNIQFTKNYAQLSARAFVIDHLSRLNIKRLIVGEDFHFGKGKEADTNDFIQLCKEINVPVTVVPLLQANGHKISSTEIRSLIKAGRVEAVHEQMGRYYDVIGEVVHGNALGRTLGYPTINLGDVTDRYVLPKPGIYLGKAEIRDNSLENIQRYALISAGYRPSVDHEGYVMEANLLDFSGDVYGKQVALSFCHYLRDEIKFNNLDLLVEQMKRDEQQARAYIQQNF